LRLILRGSTSSCVGLRDEDLGIPKDDQQHIYSRYFSGLTTCNKNTLLVLVSDSILPRQLLKCQGVKLDLNQKKIRAQHFGLAYPLLREKPEH